MPKQNTVITEELIRSIAEAPSRAAAMQKADIHPTTFYRHAEKYNIDLKTERSSYVLTTEDDALIIRLHEAGFSSRAIGEKFEVCHTTIAKRVKRHKEGKPPRGQKEGAENV